MMLNYIMSDSNLFMLIRCRRRFTILDLVLEVYITRLCIRELKNVNKNYVNLLMYVNAVSVCVYFNLLTLKLSDVYVTLILAVSVN